MTSRKTYDYTEGTLQTIKKNETFTYRSDGWKDQLLTWNGKNYTYDAGGNPTVLRGMPLTWGEGHRLKKIAAETGTITFAYDSDGKRVKKTSGNTETKYYYNGSILSGLVKTTTGNTGTTKTTVQFVYDAEGKPFLLRFNGKTDYFYLYNGLGDITGLVDSSNKVVVRYQYNSWGKVTSTQDTSGVSLATLNPFCYRKYVYDPETGLYCLGSRYYDPEVGRFVNADDFETLTYQMDSVQGKNLYQYCFNNPVNMEDEEGGWPKWVTGINWLATGVTAVCIGISVLTCGVASPVMMAVATTTVVAGTATAVNGAAEIQESVTSKNFVKDKIFKGNEKAYNVYANTTAIVAELGSSVSGAWLVKNKPRIKAYNNIENYKYTKTISDAKHMKRKYNNSVLMQKQIIKYGKMAEDEFGNGYVFSAKGYVNGKERLWRLGVNVLEETVWHFGHGF